MQPTESISTALARLRAAADRVAGGFPTTRWERVSGPGPDGLDLDGAGGFHGLALDPGRELILLCKLNLPESACAVPLAGEPLEATLNSLYPADVYWNGQCIFAEEGAPAAAGPALFTIVPELKPGPNGEVTLRARPPANQMTPWFGMKLTTPGLRRRFEALDVAWSQLALAADAASTPADERALEEAVGSVPADLAETEQEALSAALARMEAALAPLAERIAATNVHVIGHSHIDMNWLWTWPDTVEVIKRDFRNVLQLMDDYPELTFTHSQPATYEVIRQQEPTLFEQVKARIAEGRWEPATMTWVEGDVNMASGEAMARQLLEGVAYSREQLGVEPSTFLAPDTFGHAGNLPQLAASAGAVRYYHHRANPGQESYWPAYWWQGQDGSRLLAISTHTYNGEIRASDLAYAALTARKHGLPAGLHFHGIGDHGGGPSRQNLDALRRFQGRPCLPRAACGTLAGYTAQILDSGVRLPEWRGESATIFEGCYTTHADTKRYNREGENLLSSADALAAIAGLNRTADLRPAWRHVLFNQFHDILDGSAIHESYEKNSEDFREAEAAATTVAEAALSVLEAGLPADSFAVTNPLGWEREDWVVIPRLHGEKPVALVGDNGHVTYGQYTAQGLGLVARVPPYGTVSYKIQTKGADVPADIEAVHAFAPTDNRENNILGTAAADAPYLRVETPHFRVYVRKDCGALVSFYDKRTSRELVGFGMRRGSDYVDTARPDLALNVFQILDEYPHGMTAWQVHEVHAEHSLIRGATTRMAQCGPARCMLEVQHNVRKSTITQYITFYRDLPRVDFETHVDWQEVGNGEDGVPNLKAAFTARVPDAEAWFETPFAAARRPCDGQETPALRWADVGGAKYGFALLNDGKYGYDALGCRLRLSLLRSAYDPDAISDAGRHVIRYSFVPHPGDWCDAGIPKLATAFNQPLIAHEVKSAGEAAPTAPFRPVVSGMPSVVPAALKYANTGDDRVVRLYESAGRAGGARLSGLPAGARVWETNVVEDPLRELPVRDGGVDLTFRPWQVTTLRIRS